MGTNPVIARVAPHFGEEPCISGANGSGTIFFSGCTLGCVYCQNYEISSLHRGREITPQELADCYKRLEEQNVHNINLVTADHFAPAVVKSFEIYKPKIPIVYNCSGYTSPKILNMLDGIVDIYLPDFKYSNNELALKYSLAPNYVETATVAIKEMLFQVGFPQFDDRQICLLYTSPSPFFRHTQRTVWKFLIFSRKTMAIRFLSASWGSISPWATLINMKRLTVKLQGGNIRK